MYKIKLDIFEGPLDLLLYLVKKEHVNICDIPIVNITEQYLKYLELMKLLDLNIAGDFLVMAATLINIKSKMLLPQEKSEEEPEEEDPRSELVQRLLEYQKFKEVANELRDKEENRQKVFVRPRDKQLQDQPPEVYFEASVFDLISAFSKALKQVPKEVFYQVIKDEFTVEEKIHQLLHMLVKKPQVGLFELFNSAKSKLEIVAYFLAVLELIRLKEIVVMQEQTFDNIVLFLNRDNVAPIAKDERESAQQ